MRTHGGPLKALLSLYHGEKPPAIRKHLHKEVNSSSHSLGCVYFSACTYLQRSSLAQPHCAGVGTTVFVSMALGAVYLGVFQATTRGLSRIRNSSLSQMAESDQHASACPPDRQQQSTSADRRCRGDAHAALLSALVTSIVMALLTGATPHSVCSQMRIEVNSAMAHHTCADNHKLSTPICKACIIIWLL
jgi:hypothetical protein